MNSPYLKHMAEDRRLCILRLLDESKGSANESILHYGVESLGHANLPRDTIREDIRFLISQGLVTDAWYSDVQVCTITRRGVDVAQGRITVEGIKEPSHGI